jgi:xanthine dehydrogenase/oxidase
MGLGYFLTEHVVYDADGSLLTNGSFEYKLPQVKEIPAVFNVTLLDNIYNKDGILGSKATGEPCMVISNSIYFAVKMAIASARVDAGDASYFNLNVPSVVDVRQQACLVSPSRFVLPY